ncbi:MAG: CatB-related O-acetyltransferase [Methylocystaceae bacterium]|nr:CatB-related O-acetyltransferase [Methylocystaceae bacterium]
MENQEQMIQHLNKMLSSAGWNQDGWSMEIAAFSEKHLSFTEEGTNSDLIQAIHHIEDIFIGRKTYMLDGGMLSPHTVIGRYCSISRSVFIGNSNHPMQFLSTGSTPWPDRPETPPEKYTIIGCDVWIGANSTILQGRNVGHGAVIGAGSVVTKDIPPYAIAVGNPATVIKYRFDTETIKGLLETKWWTLPETAIEKLPQDNIQACIETLRFIKG